ncbi:MAG: endonuclease III domain-containing protein [Candidatus Micrarchaeia archaeon]
MDTDYDYAVNVIKKLRKRYKDKMHTELLHKNLTELFVAVLLSPQCNDNQVNKVTKTLFEKYKTFNDYSNADLKELYRYLNGLNYYKTKAKHLRESSRIIIDKFNGTVPKTINGLMELPGVGRKVANVILNEGFGISKFGIAIDTHCIVVSKRLGLTQSKKPKVIEKDLMKKLPKKYWKISSNLLIALGRDTCTAKKTFCDKCVLNKICPSSTVIKKKQNN